MILNLRQSAYRQPGLESSFDEELVFRQFGIPEITVTDVEAPTPAPVLQGRRPSIRRRMTVVSREGGNVRDGTHSGHDKIAPPRITMNLEHDSRIVLPMITEDI